MFATNRSLINPQFEGYKLDPIEQEDHLRSYPLQVPATQATASASSRSQGHLSFEQVRSRIRHNHLAFGVGDQALFVDQELGVNLVKFLE